MARRRKSGHGDPPKSPPPSLIKDALSRLAVVALLLGFAFATGSMGRHILTTGEYDYVLEVSDGDGSQTHARRESRISREEVHATGEWAREQGVGFVAASVTITYRAVIVLWGMAGPLALRAEWGHVHTLLTALSLAGCVTAVVAFYPPWRLGWSMSCNAFYLVIAAFLYLATVRDRDLVRERSRKIFPTLIASAVLLGSFSSGYLVGIIAGIFIGLLLATHVLMLVPKMRKELWTPGEAVAGNRVEV